jgi:hypothetical protein
MTVINPALTTSAIARWLGVTDEYVRGEILDGRLPFKNVGNGTRKRYTVQLTEFRQWCADRGYKRLPQLEDFQL